MKQYFSNFFCQYNYSTKWWKNACNTFLNLNIIKLPLIICRFFDFQTQEIDTLIGKDRETFYTSGLTLGSKKCSVLRDSLQNDGDWTMDIRTKSQGGEPTYNISVGRAGKGREPYNNWWPPSGKCCHERDLICFVFFPSFSTQCYYLL